MKSSEICSLAIRIVTWQYGEVQYRQNNTVVYPDRSWCNMSWYNGTWHSDCLGLVRAVLCGWNANKAVPYGGADTSYRCYWFAEIDFLNSCSYTSSNFTEIEQHPCSLLYKNGHVGLYVGDFTCTIDGVERVCNVCEVSLGLGAGGIPSYVTPEGGRCHYQGDYVGDYWESWGVFNLNGTDYGITEYDGGGSVGFAGIGKSLSQAEVTRYWDNTQVPDGEYLIELIVKLYGVTKTVARMCVGWAYGEGYQFYDTYMGYLCNSIPFNLIKGYGYTSGANLAYNLGGGDTSGFYSQTALRDRGIEACTSDSGLAQLARHSVLLACLNPEQRVRGCNGVDRPPADAIIYSAFINGYTINAYEDYFGGVHWYETTGLGIRGGLPSTDPKSQKKMPLWMMIKPWFRYKNFYLYRYH